MNEETTNAPEITSEILNDDLFPDTIDVKPNLNFLDRVKSDKKDFDNWRDVDDANREIAFLARKEKELSARRIKMITHIDSVYGSVKSALTTKREQIKRKADGFILKHSGEMHVVSDSNEEERREIVLDHSKITVIHKTILKTEIKKDEPKEAA